MPSTSGVIQQAARSPRQQSKLLSHTPSQSSSMPLHNSEIGSQLSGWGMLQSIVHIPLPTEPHCVTQDTGKPLRHGKVSSTRPLQLSSMPLQASTSEVATHSVSQLPSLS